MKKTYCDCCGNEMEYSYAGSTFPISKNKYTSEPIHFNVSVADSRGNVLDICKHCTLMALKHHLSEIGKVK